MNVSLYYVLLSLFAISFVRGTKDVDSAYSIPSDSDIETRLDNDTNICRVCFDEVDSIEDEDPWLDQFRNQFISPCKCRGSSQFIHLTCFVKLIENTNKGQCSVCLDFYNHSLLESVKRPNDLMDYWEYDSGSFFTKVLMYLLNGTDRHNPQLMLFFDSMYFVMKNILALFLMHGATVRMDQIASTLSVILLAVTISFLFNRKQNILRFYEPHLTNYIVQLAVMIWTQSFDQTLTIFSMCIVPLSVLLPALMWYLFESGVLMIITVFLVPYILNMVQVILISNLVPVPMTQGIIAAVLSSPEQLLLSPILHAH